MGLYKNWFPGRAEIGHGRSFLPRTLVNEDILGRDLMGIREWPLHLGLHIFLISEEPA